LFDDAWLDVHYMAIIGNKWLSPLGARAVGLGQPLLAHLRLYPEAVPYEG